MADKRTYADRREELIRAVAKRRRKIKTLAIEYKGGKCQICGYNKYQGALDLHHVNGEKEFGIADKGYTRSWEKVRQELDKCVLVCANCHRELEAGIIELSNGKIFRGSSTVERLAVKSSQLPEAIQDEKRGEIGEA